MDEFWEKIIRGLECCRHDRRIVYENLKTVCDSCPYSGEPMCYMNLKDDAYHLLKVQVPVKPIYETLWDNTMGRCGHCNAPLPMLEGLKSKFCWMCGRAVKWE